ncbi:MAG: ATP-binding protein [Bacteroidales bacterium]|nr:ATP-binding protein [Bacteroidales bacterium]
MIQPNPFIITADYQGPDYFCDRVEETEMLESNISNGRNTVLVSSRRMGKSGLIAHVFGRELVRKNFRTFSIDLYPTSSLAEMILLLAKEITAPLKSTEQKIIESFLAVAKSLRAGFKVDSVTGQFVFDLSLGEIVRPAESLAEIFQYLENSEIPCLVAIDEFQKIADYPDNNVIELLRTHVQKCRQTWFIFAGSDRRMMEKLFNNPSEPFYMSCSPLYLDAIDYRHYIEFARHHFENAGKHLDDECFKRVYDLFEGHTWYVQRLLNELYAWTGAGQTAGPTLLSDVLSYVIKTYARTFQEQMSKMPDTHKQLLIAVAKEGRAEQVTSIAFCKKHSMKSPSTVQSALRALHEDGTINRVGNTYYVTNRLLGLWLKTEY